PPANLTEIVDATISVLRDPEIDIEDLLKIVKGPDFPTRGFICGREEIRNSYLTGRGILQMRARASIDRIGRGTQERDAVIISEIPSKLKTPVFSHPLHKCKIKRNSKASPKSEQTIIA